MLFAELDIQQDALRQQLSQAYRRDETEVVQNLLATIQLSKQQQENITQLAYQLVATARQQKNLQSDLDKFLLTYNLSSDEGIALMCLAEALLRIPDKQTVDELIRDKISLADWKAHVGESESFFVNATTWGLLLTGKITEHNQHNTNQLSQHLKRLVSRSSEPLIRKAILSAMKTLGRSFVMGKTIDEGIKRAQALEQQGYRYSFDMLGEAAHTFADAQTYFVAYQQALTRLAEKTAAQNIYTGPSISVKLSALHPRYEYAQRQQVVPFIVERLLQLTELAKNANISITIDAEEADRLDLSLDIFAQVFAHPSLKDWPGLGLAVQSYQKRAMPLLDWLHALAQQHNKRIFVRLIKGAYWDSEIKQSQELGLSSYPVFTRKNNTDISFIACAKKLLASPEVFYPQFATHNAHSIALILELTDAKTEYEFQCLHGMGLAIYDQIVAKDKYTRACRIYAPIGEHDSLLPYLVRRLLENGANTSFVHCLFNEKVSIDSLIADPLVQLAGYQENIPHPKIPLPQHIYANKRLNSSGIDLSNPSEIAQLGEALETACKVPWYAKPLLGSKTQDTKKQAVLNPCDHRKAIGFASFATQEQVEQALTNAVSVASGWNATPVAQRAAILEKFADLVEAEKADFIAIAIREAGKTIPDAIAEVREAIDFARYYAQLARSQCEKPQILQGVTGELNQLSWQGRGPTLCISPWNFPLAIFIGQVTAALVAGNPVIAKPATQTTLIAARAVNLLHQAGIPKAVLQFLPGSGEKVGMKLVADPRIKAVIFTGSTQTARTINQTLADRAGAIIPFIAETGGLNAMLVDSSALAEQVIPDVILSAFGSAGQRCSALRLLCLQNEIADKMISMLKGAMATLRVSDPVFLSSDVGPVIDANAQQMLQAHVERMKTEAQLIYQANCHELYNQGTFFGPCAFELKHIDQLQHEVFGPILHIVRFSAKKLEELTAAINAKEYGLTFGIHSRIHERIEMLSQKIQAGNIYANRNMIGAVVGVQPFGGEGLSGTGPKAGGPHYLMRLMNEKTLCINTTAAGGNASLLNQESE